MKFSDMFKGNRGENPDEQGTVRGFGHALREYIELNIENVRLTAAQKTTVFLTTVAFAAVIFIIGSMVLLFLSIGIGHLLATTIAPHWAYMFVAAFYVLLLVIVIACKRTILLNPIARFMTRLLLAPPEENATAGEDDYDLSADASGTDYDLGAEPQDRE